MKEQGTNPLEQTNEEEIGSLPKKEFRVMIEKMIQNLENRMEQIKETLYFLHLEEEPRRTKGPRRTKQQTNNDEQHNK